MLRMRHAAKRCVPNKLTKADYSVLFMGTDDVAVPSLESLVKQQSTDATGGGPVVDKITVITPPESVVRRKRKQLTLVPPVAELAQRHALPHVAAPEIKPGVPGASIRDALVQWQGLNELIQQHGPFDVAVVVSFGYFLTPNVLKACKMGAINMHPSLLPAWRGAAPIPRSLLAGDAATGVSVIAVDPRRWDAGDILWQQRLPIGEEESESQLRSRCARVGAHAVLDTLHAMQQGTLQRQPQGSLPAESPRKHAAKLPKSLAHWPSDAATLRAAELHARVRACGARMGLHGAVQGSKHTIIIRALARHASVAPAPTGVVSNAVPLCALPDASPPQATRVELPSTLAAADPAAQPTGTLVYDKGSKTLWLGTRDDWLQVVAADLKSKPAMPLHVLANHLGLASAGQPTVQAGVVSGPVARLEAC